MLRRLVPLTVLVAFAMGVLPIAAPVDDPLAQGFETPPDSAKPRVWWHWMNGNITREGITRDLEWMHRIGIGGFQNFDAALAPVKVVDTRIVYMTPEWKEAFRYAIELADRLGLETAIAGSPGWSESGGPWVQPAQGMKKLVWSETRLRGGAPFHARLAKPPSTTGPFQNARLIDPGDARMGLTPAPPPELYRDTVVIAYRVPDGDVAFADLKPTVTSSGGAIDVAGLSDGDVENFSALPKAPVGERAWVQIEFSRPQTIRGATLALAGYIWPYGPRPEGPDLESSADGQSFTKVVNIPMTLSPETTVSFAPVTAPIFRLSFRTPPPETGASPLRLPPPPTHQIAEFVLHTGARVHRFEEKAAFATMPDLSTVPTAAVASRDSVKKADVIDLTARMKPDGTLHWMPPPGQWVVLRFGYSLLGIKNHPASPEGTGLEVDKLSAEHVKAYMRTYLDSYQSALGSLMGKRGLQYLISDSWEARAQNWTENVLQEFARRRGYDAHPWLPALTGRVIDSAEASDRFLWDFRRTLSDMVAEYHYDQITAILKARGMGHYGESHEGGRAFIGDGMEVKRSNDVPMAAMWTQLPGVNTEQYGYNADIRESASVAHLYGQNLVAAESLTARSGAWAWSPATLKPTADKELALGLNRFVIHTSVHQPLVDKGPGLSLGPYGQWFTRNETWAEQAKAWITYLARCSYMLQQGRFVADVLYFYGEDSNLTALFAGRAPAVPAGYNFDYVNADALVHVLTVKDGNLATPSGMRYRVLVIDPRARQMSLPVLRKLRDLVMAGANIVGPKPAGSPSLSDDDATFAHLADELWGSGDASEERTAGKGRVFGDMPIADALAHLAVTPDVEYAKTKPDSQLLFVHRSLPDGEAYFVNNRNDHDETVDVTFRVAGKSPELWHPDSGLREPVGFQIVNGRTTVHLHLEPWDTVFVVFRKDTTETRRPDPLLISRTLSTLDGAWNVSFQADRGAPDTITLPMLASWSDNTNPGVKYFSGTGTYTRSLDAPADWFRPDPPGTPATQLWLDLGDVRELAEVSINGTPLGIIWKRPYRVNATGFLKPGANAVVIKVTNLWVNRMIGDQQPHAARQDTFTVPTFYKADSPLVPSGMLGPVTVRQVMAH